MTGDCQARICGGLGVRFPRATRPKDRMASATDMAAEWNVARPTAANTIRRSGRPGQGKDRRVVPPGVQPARHDWKSWQGGPPASRSAPPPQQAVEHVEGSGATCPLSRPDSGEYHPGDHEDDEHAEDQQGCLAPHQARETVADLGHHRKLVELAASSAFTIAYATAYAIEHVRPLTTRSDFMD